MTGGKRVYRFVVLDQLEGTERKQLHGRGLNVTIRCHTSDGLDARPSNFQVLQRSHRPPANRKSSPCVPQNPFKRSMWRHSRRRQTGGKGEEVKRQGRRRC